MGDQDSNAPFRIVPTPPRMHLPVLISPSNTRERETIAYYILNYESVLFLVNSGVWSSPLAIEIVASAAKGCQHTGHTFFLFETDKSAQTLTEIGRRVHRQFRIELIHLRVYYTRVVC
jgi:hypothetical protein